MAREGHLVVRGSGRSSRWEVASNERAYRFAIAGLAEDRVWSELARDVPVVASLTAEARTIAAYAFTEMLNNAIEHSGSKTVDVRVRSGRAAVGFEIVDRGVGAFETVRAKLELPSALDALGEISKGKTTSAPEAHAGEGIFFTSKAVETFVLEANGLAWTIDNARADMAVARSALRRGTRVTFRVSRAPARTLKSVFDEYTGDFAFARTRAVVRLFERGGEFVSRSEARRMLSGLERFREVIFDFDRVASVGQGFADEVFRVWPKAHPDVAVSTENANEEVAFMIRRACA